MKKFLESLLGKSSGGFFSTLLSAGVARLLFGKQGYQSWKASQTGEALTGAQQEANAFSASEAQKNRDFQQEMSDTSYQRTVADMRAAGVNPALAMNQGPVSTPAGDSASSVSPSGAGMSMSDLANMFLIKPQLEIMRAQADNIRADTGKKLSETDLVEKHISAFDVLTDAQVRDIDSQIATREVQQRLNEAGISEAEARTALAAQQTINAHLDSEWIAKLNDASLKYQNALTSMTNQKTKESAELVKKYAAEIDGIYNQAILQSAMAGYYTQAEEESLKRCGILDYDASEKKFIVDHLKSDRNWRIADTATKMVGNLVGAGAGAAIGVGALGKAGMLGRSVTSASPWSFHNTGGYDFIGF